MINILNFVRGSVSSKDILPILQNFHIYDGRIQGTNGRLTIDAPCPELKGMHFTVSAAPFLKAVDACDGEPVLKIKDDGGKLQISRGKFKAILPLDDHSAYPIQKIEGEQGISGGINLMTELKQLITFVGDDAQKPWACGILFRKGLAVATNNVVFAAMPGYTFPEDINLPSFAADELLRVNAAIVGFRATKNNVTFEFENGSWMKTSILALDWPDVARFMPTEVIGTKIGTDLINDIRRILPFCPDPKNPVVRFTGEAISTMDGDKNAVIDGHTLPESAWRAEPLLSVLVKAAEIDFTPYPKPCPFKGDHGLVGVIIGYQL